MTIRIDVAREYSRTPGSRYINEGDFSGEKFRNSVLRPRVIEAIATGQTIQVVLDGTAGYGTSFLEEAFGGLVRNDRIDAAWLLKNLTLVSDDEPYLINDIRSYIYGAGEKERAVE